MEIPPLGSSPRDRREQCAGLGHLLYNYSFYRTTRSARKYGREREMVWDGPMAWGGAKEAKKESDKGESEKDIPGWEGGGERKRVDNSQDRIVPGAKNRSVPECYRMVETRALAGRLLRTLLLKMPPGENCFIRAGYTWQYQLAHRRSTSTISAAHN